jgi:hypothetical protein
LGMMEPVGGSATPGRVAVARFKIENTGLATDLVRLNATHAQGWTAQLQHQVIEIAAGETAEIPVYVAVPEDAAQTKTLLSFTATSETDGEASVQGQTTVTVAGAAALEPESPALGPESPGSDPSLPGTGVNTRWLAGACALALAALLDRARRHRTA